MFFQGVASTFVSYSSSNIPFPSPGKALFTALVALRPKTSLESYLLGTNSGAGRCLLFFFGLNLGGLSNGSLKE